MLENGDEEEKMVSCTVREMMKQRLARIIRAQRLRALIERYVRQT